MSSTMPGDSICFSCGRVITGSGGMDDRVKGNFQRASSSGAVKGKAPQMMMRYAKVPYELMNMKWFGIIG